MCIWNTVGASQIRIQKYGTQTHLRQHRRASLNCSSQTNSKLQQTPNCRCASHPNAPTKCKMFLLAMLKRECRNNSTTYKVRVPLRSRQNGMWNHSVEYGCKVQRSTFASMNTQRACSQGDAARTATAATLCHPFKSLATNKPFSLPCDGFCSKTGKISAYSSPKVCYFAKTPCMNCSRSEEWFYD